MMRIILCLWFLLPSFAWGATPTHDATTDTVATTFGNVQNPSFSHTRGATCPNAVAIISVVSQDSTPGTISSVTYGGSSATQLGSTVTWSTLYALSLWIYKGPASGAATVQANFSEVMNAVTIRASTYCNVSQSDTPTPTTTTGSGTSLSVNCSSASGHLVVDALGTNNGASALTVGASQTQRYSQGVGGNQSHAGSEEAGAGTVTMSWTWTGAAVAGMGCIDLVPASDRRPIGPMILGN